MDKSNIIISIIIVLCIAAAVTVYGLTNNDNAIFSDLANLDSSGDSGSHGVGNSSSGNGHATPSSSGSRSGSGSGGSGSGGSGGGGSGGGGSNPQISQAQAQNIAQKAIGQPGCTAGTPVLRGDYWYVPVYDSNGNNVDCITVHKNTGIVGRG